METDATNLERRQFLVVTAGVLGTLTLRMPSMHALADGSIFDPKSHRQPFPVRF